VFVAREGTQVKIRKQNFFVLCSKHQKIGPFAPFPITPSPNAFALTRVMTLDLVVLAQVAISKRVKCKLMLDDC